MVIKIAVCDDEFSAVSQIDVYLTQIQRETGLQFQIFYFSSGEELLQNMPRDINILLLDIQMGDLSGIEAARKLRKEGVNFYLFFITSNVQYALEGYEVHAYSFLRKPLQYVRLRSSLLEVAALLKRAKPFTLKLKSGGTHELVDCSKLLYVEVYGHSTSFVFENKTSTFQVSLNELEPLLSPHGFFRCHKSYLINLHKISSVRASEIQMSNGDVIALSKHRKQAFYLALQEVVGESL